jgi:hypothetical protein
LHPLDGSSSKEGLFPCGRVKNEIESKAVILPAGYKCDHCILQLSWRVDDTTYYTCSDVSLPDGGVYFDAATYLQGSKGNLAVTFELARRSMISLVQALSFIGLVLIGYQVYK